MEVHDAGSDPRPGPDWDRLTEALQALRRSVGEPSYAEIARRTTERRIRLGESEHAARVARTTVYDAFRTGRARVNLTLVRDIALALGGTDAQVDEWIDRCHEPAAPEPAAQPAPPAQPPPGGDPASAGADWADGVTGAEGVAGAPLASPQRATMPRRVPRPRRSHVLLLMAGCVVLNLFGHVFEEVLDLPIYLDMVGTAIAAMALGPWHGALVGVASNSLGVVTSGPSTLPFGLVNLAGALAWGYGVRRFGLGRTLPRFFGLNVAVAMVCSLMSVPLLVLMFDGPTGHGQDTLTGTLYELTHTLVVALGFSSMLVSLADKVISGFLALVAISVLPEAMRSRVPLVAASAPQQRPEQEGQRHDGTGEEAEPQQQGL